MQTIELTKNGTSQYLTPNLNKATVSGHVIRMSYPSETFCKGKVTTKMDFRASDILVVLYTTCRIATNTCILELIRRETIILELKVSHCIGHLIENVRMH